MFFDLTQFEINYSVRRCSVRCKTVRNSEVTVSEIENEHFIREAYSYGQASIENICETVSFLLRHWKW